MRILYFASLRERIGLAEESLDIPADVTTVATLTAWLRQRSAGHAAAFAAGGVRCALNQELAAATAPLAGAVEAAFFPPMTGG